jgi:hypothetical protein
LCIGVSRHRLLEERRVHWHLGKTQQVAVHCLPAIFIRATVEVSRLAEDANFAATRPN